MGLLQADPILKPDRSLIGRFSDLRVQICPIFADLDLASAALYFIFACRCICQLDISHAAFLCMDFHVSDSGRALLRLLLRLHAALTASQFKTRQKVAYGSKQ